MATVLSMSTLSTFSVCTNAISLNEPHNLFIYFSSLALVAVRASLLSVAPPRCVCVCRRHRHMYHHHSAKCTHQIVSIASYTSSCQSLVLILSFASFSSLRLFHLPCSFDTIWVNDRFLLFSN